MLYVFDVVVGCGCCVAGRCHSGAGGSSSAVAECAHEVVGSAQRVELAHVHESSVALGIATYGHVTALAEVEVDDRELVGPSRHAPEQARRNAVYAAESIGMVTAGEHHRLIG